MPMPDTPPYALTPAQRVIVMTWQRVKAEPGDWCYNEGDDRRYAPEDHVVAARLGVTVERVDEAMVAAGKRPPVSWIG